MARQEINLGSYANDGTGDDLRTAFEKVNANFLQVYNNILDTSATNVGPTTGNIGKLFAQKNVNSLDLEFRTLTSIDNTVTITQNSTTVNLESTAKVESDTDPVLGGNLNLNGFDIIDDSAGFTSSINVPIFGISVPIMNSLLELLLVSNGVSVDMGGIREDLQAGWNGTTGSSLDLGYFTGITYPNNNLDFGQFN
jgi:hypothetical protein